MKWYVCPECNVSSSTKKWDESTEISYPGEIYSVDDDDEREDCMYTCPSCGNDVSGYEIKVG